MGPSAGYCDEAEQASLKNPSQIFFVRAEILTKNLLPAHKAPHRGARPQPEHQPAHQAPHR